MKHFDFCIVGSGIAGMSAALRLADSGTVCIITKGSLLSGSTPLAQGGIAAVTDFENDSFASHMQDTINAGGKTNSKESVQILVESAPEIMNDLFSWGVEFEREKHLEGGHSYPRIFHAHDQSGKKIAEVLAKRIQEHKNITVRENYAAFSLLANQHSVRCQNLTTQTSVDISYSKLIIATGGYSSLYAASTSPYGNTGDGMAMAMIAGAKTKELSKVQFHPTVLNIKRSPRLLLTEAIRGAGATIVTETGEEIISPLKPRDTVSKAIWKSEQEGYPAFLDARNIEHFQDKFPFIHSSLEYEFHLHPSKNLLPITFGAHYCMGGLETDTWGRTSLRDVYAIGECANNGVHGNNRLASNSLLEGLVFARQCTLDIEKNSDDWTDQDEDQYKEILVHSDFIPSDKEKEAVFFTEIQNTLSVYMSIERTPENCRKAQEKLNNLSPQSTREINAMKVAMGIIEDANKGF